jgi:hypothetical protein
MELRFFQACGPVVPSEGISCACVDLGRKEEAQRSCTRNDEENHSHYRPVEKVGRGGEGLKQTFTSMTSSFIHKHAIAVGVKTIALRDCMLVGAKNIVFPCQGTDQH